MGVDMCKFYVKKKKCNIKAIAKICPKSCGFCSVKKAAQMQSCKPALVKGISKNLASKAQATPHREALVGEMRKWAVCKLSDGQIDGKGHGGQIENSHQNGYDCSISCGHAEDVVLAEEDLNGHDDVFADGTA